MPVSADGQGGTTLRVRVTPRAKQTMITGIVEADGRLAIGIRLAAPPVDGAANKALVRFLAGTLGVPKSAVTLMLGETGRLKLLRVAGLSVEAAQAAISVATISNERSRAR